LSILIRSLILTFYLFFGTEVGCKDMVPCTMGNKIGRVGSSNTPFEAGFFFTLTTSSSSNVISKIDYGASRMTNGTSVTGFCG
jgi:hypothetical protein